MMLYLFPIIFAVGGINFKMGVLIYWFASNLWTMGQQFYVIRRNPGPGTPAYEAWEQRKLAKAKHKNKGKDLAMANVPSAEPVEEAAPPPPRVVRQQPRKQTRSQRRT